MLYVNFSLEVMNIHGGVMGDAKSPFPRAFQASTSAQCGSASTVDGSASQTDAVRRKTIPIQREIALFGLVLGNS